VLAHECDHACFIDTKLNFNRFKWRAIFPRHLHDAVDGGEVESDNLLFHSHIISDEVRFSVVENIFIARFYEWT
jgi:hypothetical protein